LAPLTEDEFQQIPVTAHGKIQEYEVAVEGRFDEDEQAIDILNEQMQPAPESEKEPATHWWQFWR